MPDIKTAIDRLAVDEQLHHHIVHGDDTAEVVTESGVQPSVRKAIKDSLDATAVTYGTTLADIAARLNALEN